VEKYGAFNISLINDLPLFIDPFLLFNSDKPEYQALHQSIIRYVRFLREVSAGGLSTPLIDNWFKFPEIKQNWLGYSAMGNVGHNSSKTSRSKRKFTLEPQLQLSLRSRRSYVFLIASYRKRIRS
jgi:hypothetical protein